MKDINIHQLVYDYQVNKMSNMKLAKKYLCTNSTIRNYLIKAGVYKPQRKLYNNSK